ncbi:MAG TPA: glutamyl-tRNA reductase, partial [Micromonosporaceae bacterium]|nr:glutamyl-tRNA reductase [Micromonosporaceae bacterium]
ERSGQAPHELASHVYVQYDADAVRHAYRVAAGLDSMVVGEAQILGQFREAYQLAADREAAGRMLHELMQQALRVGKKVHTDTDIDRAGQSVVTAALALAASTGPLAGRPSLVVGAGAMGSLALATLQREGAGPLSVSNRGSDRATRLAAAYDATAVPFGELSTALSTVDVAVFATSSAETLLPRSTVEEAVAARGSDRGPLVLLDLAIPRDVDPTVADLPGVMYVDIERLGASLRGGPTALDVDAADFIVAAEVEAFLTWLRSADVAPAVAALRARAEEVVSTELNRLVQRRPDLTEDQRADIAQAIHRVVQRLLHSPTVRVRELAAGPDGDRYAELLRELFDLEVTRQVEAKEALR